MIPLVSCLLATVAFSAPLDHQDRVAYLPGAPLEPSFPLYSGYLNVEENSTQHSIFYVLCEAIRIDPTEAPLLVWLNGGPGSSSLFGLLMEHGPYLIEADTKELRYNDFSWNQYANVLYIESPSGVGFSFSNYSEFNYYNDNSTAVVNRRALQDFMTRVHPQYATRVFFLTGESYGGIYIPYLAREIVNHAKTGEFTNANLKGIAMGNAAVYDFGSNMIPSALQLYSMGLYPMEQVNVLFESWKRTLAGEHIQSQNNVYDVLGPNAFYDRKLECNRKEDETIWHIAKPKQNAECNVDELLETYLNRADVQESLHVRGKTGQHVNWTALSSSVRGTYEIDEDSTHIYKDILANAQEGFRILYYTGDLDFACPPMQVALGTKMIAKRNDMMNATGPREWRYLGDFGGARTTYTTRNGRISMDVITVRGAGHYVPINMSDRAFQIINNFITADPFEAVDYSKMIPRRGSLPTD